MIYHPNQRLSQNNEKTHTQTSSSQRVVINRKKNISLSVRNKKGNWFCDTQQVLLVSLETKITISKDCLPKKVFIRQ